jgi:sirohydrochlorin ferrochelatase
MPASTTPAPATQPATPAPATQPATPAPATEPTTPALATQPATPAPATEPTALLVIAHGSRRPEANADLEAIAARLREAGIYPLVRTAYLELAEPDIVSGGVQCVADGAKAVILLPYFLSPGVHVREDLAAARDELAARFPAVAFRLAEPIGGHPLLTQILFDRAAAATTADDGAAAVTPR